MQISNDNQVSFFDATGSAIESLKLEESLTKLYNLLCETLVSDSEISFILDI